jgi:hypothetical protein
MDNSHSSNHPAAARTTLKLKNGARKSTRENKTPAATTPIRESKVKPGAHWSDEYKERMQADMDALTSQQKRR